MSAPAKSHSGGRQIAEESGVAVGCRLQAQRRRDNGALGRWRQVVGSQGYAPYLFSRSPSFISYPPPSFSIFLARSLSLSHAPPPTHTQRHRPPWILRACVFCTGSCALLLTGAGMLAGLLTWFGQKRDDLMSQSGAGMYAQRDYFGKDR
jgi:hypothetical protein